MDDKFKFFLDHKREMLYWPGQPDKSTARPNRFVKKSSVFSGISLVEQLLENVPDNNLPTNNRIAVKFYNF